MASTTAVLKSASSLRQKAQSFQDAQVAYEWQLSAKTYEDFLSYSKYLEEQAGRTADPMDQFNYLKAIDSARSGFISNEIQRESINIVEGRGTTVDKYNKMYDLFVMAANEGQYDLAQSLRLQLDNLSVSIQNEDAAAQRAAGSMALNGAKSLDDLAKSIQRSNQYIELADGSVIKSIPMLEAEVKSGGDTGAGFFNELRKTIEGLQDVAIDMYESATTQEAVDKIEEKYGAFIEGTGGFGQSKGLSVGGLTLTPQEIVLAAQSAAANNPIYRVESSFDGTTGQQKFALKKNDVDNFIWIRNDDGTYSATQEMTSFKPENQRLNTQITDDGQVIGSDGSIMAGEDNVKRDNALSIGNRLASMGIKATENDDGTVTLITKDGVFKGTVLPDGTVRYFGAAGNYSGGGAGLYEINPLTRTSREVAPDEVSDFGGISQFGGMISNASEAGRNYLRQYREGPSMKPVDLRGAMIGLDMDTPISGRGSAVAGGILQNAQFTRNAIAQEEARRQALAQSATALLQQGLGNINQTPVRQMASNGAPVKQLTVRSAPQQNSISVVTAPQQKNIPLYKPASSGGGSLSVGKSPTGNMNIRL